MKKKFYKIIAGAFLAFMLFSCTKKEETETPTPIPEADIKQILTSTDQFLLSIDFPSSTIGYIVGDGGGVLKSINGGERFIEISSPVSTPLYATDFITEDKGIVAGNNNELYVTSTGGTSWTKPTLPVSGFNFRDVHYVDENTVFVVAGSSSTTGCVLKSTNGGTTWSNVTSSSMTSMYSVNFYTSTNGVASGYGGKIFYTTDGGANWTQATVNFGTINSSGVIISMVQMASATVGYATGFVSSTLNTPVVLKTTDGGMTWSLLTLSATAQYNANVYTSLVIADVNTVYLVGGNVNQNTASLLLTRDGGSTWESKDVTDYQRLYAGVKKGNGFYFTGNYGVILLD